MPDRRSKGRPCDAEVAEERVAQAEVRLEYAEMALKEGDFNVATELAVTAGINLSDAICCLVTGEYVQGGAHADALGHLRQADPKAATVLGRLLKVKTRASYGGPIGRQAAERAVRNARQMMTLARDHLDS